jgi:hypothetical protein
MEKPNLSKQAFWDVHFDKIDYQKNADFVITRIFEYGSLSDLRALLDFYGLERSKQAIINARFLKKNAINTASLIFDIQRNTIPCYNTKPSRIPF